jgi:2,7-dihydroxy-5-methyl-1-naphthoate 7-O-methyltransferase
MSKEKVEDIWSLIDLCTPWCVHVAATLRIAEHIAAGKNQIDDLARAAGSDRYALHRMLTHLVGKGVFEEPAPGVFRLNETARQLLDPAWRIGLDLEGIGGRMAHTWGTMLTYVQTGEPAYADVFGLPFWDDLEAHPKVKASFDALMGPAGHGTPNPDFQITGGWETVRSVVDVGGGTGAMLAEILRMQPEVRGILVDLPKTVATAAETFQAAGVDGRVTIVGQSFFEALPGGADLYILKKVLDDWPDRDAERILRRCAEAAWPNGRVIVLGGVVADDATRPLEIQMLLLGGKIRSVSEFQALAGEAGLELMAAGRQASGYFVVECRPKSVH